MGYILTHFSGKRLRQICRDIFMKSSAYCYKREFCLRKANFFVFFHWTKQGYEVVTTLVYPKHTLEYPS